ncbi:MAG TPA: tRNA guanosine(34) transglycosylase Tgt [Syntrophorhabdaceae bacterium]|nr:tRNA guanosine(34) transglycosylase Tgt [Syntrophorhabdaceae bacterium]HPU30780.1 tRNA guanosine(34) transglycosylase Tgt [Syntrophorhabdaceae bacterium]
MEIIEILKKSENARLGILKTNHGNVDTPVFMPVGTQGTIKAATHKDLKEIGIQMILSNAYHLYLRPGDTLIKDLGGIHKFSSWDKAVLTDSGGYQIFSLGVLRKIRPEGVEFQSHIDGSKHFLTPERVIEIQDNIGSDIWMCLDECVPYPSSYEYTEKSIELTKKWAERSKKAKKNGKAALFGIIQGGFYKDLRIRSANELIELDFDGYAIGGLSVGEPKSLMWDMVDAIMEMLPHDKPRYLMGLGFPEDIIEGVKRGIDMFDCIIPTRVARNGGLFTWEGKINIKNAKYQKDKRPIDENCGCYTCRTYSRAYLRHLIVSHELTSFYLNTLHNIYFYNELLKKIREAIKMDVFDEFYNEFKSRWKGGEIND